MSDNALGLLLHVFSGFTGWGDPVQLEDVAGTGSVQNARCKASSPLWPSQRHSSSFSPDPAQESPGVSVGH